MIDRQLNTETLSPGTLVTLISCSQAFQLDSKVAVIVADLIESSSYRLEADDRDLACGTLSGLAVVSATTRSTVLADRIVRLVQESRLRGDFDLRPLEVVQICLAASASYHDLDKWAEFVGKWFSGIAFGDLTALEASQVLEVLALLLSAAPELRSSCSRAEAGLIAYLESTAPNEVPPGNFVRVDITD